MKTILRVLIIGLALAISPAWAEDDQAVKKDLAQFQGEWTIIYELEGDTVKFCFGAPDGERPADFTSKPGDRRTLSVWKREKEAAPQPKQK